MLSSLRTSIRSRTSRRCRCGRTAKIANDVSIGKNGVSLVERRGDFYLEVYRDGELASAYPIWHCFACGGVLGSDRVSVRAFLSAVASWWRRDQERRRLLRLARGVSTLDECADVLGMPDRVLVFTEGCAQNARRWRINGRGATKRRFALLRAAVNNGTSCVYPVKAYVYERLSRTRILLVSECHGLSRIDVLPSEALPSFVELQKPTPAMERTSTSRHEVPDGEV